jgi:hypothetical protein
LRKFRNARKEPDRPAIIWYPEQAVYVPNRAARRSPGAWGWRHTAINATLAEHARAVALLLTGKEIG